jgi:PAT family acetyl-CoA transporter-like MFS transporter 1
VTLDFFVLYVLMATQDIAVDGWALTMLSRANVGYASTCNSVGQTLGYFIAYIGFLTLNDPATVNTYFRRTPVDEQGLVSLGGFVQFWGWVFIVTTVYVWVFKPEHAEHMVRSDSRDILEKGVRRPDYSGHWNEVVSTYRDLWAVLRLPNMKWLVVILLTCKIGFAVTDGAASLKLVEYGIPKEQMAAFAPVMVVLGILLPVMVGKFTNGPRPLGLFVYGMPLRMVSGAVVAYAIVVTRDIYNQENPDPPSWFWSFVVACIALASVSLALAVVAARCSLRAGALLLDKLQSHVRRANVVFCKGTTRTRPHSLPSDCTLCE